MSVEIPTDNCPWVHPDGNVMVAALPVAWWGSLLDVPARLPAAWTTGRPSPEPTDFEFECYIHLIEHEQARVKGRERQLLAECTGIFDAELDGVAAAVADGHSLIGWCPGVPWKWKTEQRGQPFRKQQY